MSDGLFLLLLAAVGFGVRQLTLAIPIPEAAVRRYVEQQRPHELLPMQHGPTEEDDWFVKRSDMFDSDDLWSTDDGVNVDGTPMIGDVDINGNSFGVTDDW